MKANRMLLWSILAVSACSDGPPPPIDWRYSADLNGDGVNERVEVRDLNGNGRPDPLGDLHLVGSGKSLEGRLRIEAELEAIIERVCRTGRPGGGFVLTDTGGIPPEMPEQKFSFYLETARRYREVS